MMRAPRMRLLVLCHYLYDTAPGLRFRIEQWAPHLQSLGWQIEFASFEDRELRDVLRIPGQRLRKVRALSAAFRRRFRLIRRIREYDAVFLYQEAALIGPPLLERWIRRSEVPFILDFDDAIFLKQESTRLSWRDALRFSGWISALRLPGKTGTICRLAAHVTPGNEYLAEYARRFNSHVTVVPTTIDTDKYVPKSGQSDPLVIGWSGSESTVKYVAMLRAVLQRLRKTRTFRVLIIGTAEYAIDGVEVEAMPWRAASEVEDLHRIDIGVMPLTDDPWSRGKCGLKALQYMALGIPAVCSPVGVNSTIIRDGENGFLAATEDDWYDRLARLLDDAALRRRIGAAGRDTVEQKYSARVQVPRLDDVLRAAATLRRREGPTA